MIALLGLLAPIVGKILDKIPDPGEREKVRLEFELKMREQESELIKAFITIDQGQIDVNKEEAKSGSLFVAGWRPFCGWIAGFGCAWAFVLKPFLDWGLAALHYTIVTPNVETGELMSLLLGMLGMGALRSYEKVRGVASK